MAVKTKKRPPRQKKATQTFLPGMEPPRIKEIDDAAETYHTVKLERCELSKEEDQAKDNLIDKMKSAGLDRYETPDGLTVTVTASSNVKTKRKAKHEQNGDGEDNGDGE